MTYALPHPYTHYYFLKTLTSTLGGVVFVVEMKESEPQRD